MVGKRNFGKQLCKYDFLVLVLCLSFEVLLESALNICVRDEITSDNNELVIDCLKLVYLS